MRKSFLFSLGLVASLAVSAVQMNYQLLQSQYPDPTRMSMSLKEYPNWATLATGTTGEADVSAWTQIFWIKDGNPDTNTWGKTCLGLQQFFSTRCGMSGSEGAPNRPAIQSWDYNTPLTLTDGQWADANALPPCADYDLGGMKDGTNAWQYGCYMVNIETDSDLTLTVGDSERNISASNELQVTNFQCETGSRAVSIVCSNPDAVIKLGLADNPLVEFHGDMLQAVSSSSSLLYTDPTEHYIGLTNEWTMIVSRARINTDKTISYQLDCYYYDCDHPGTLNTKTPNWTTPEAKFGKWSRIAVQACSYDISNTVVKVYGHKIFRGWLDDEFISVIRDQDVRELHKRGEEFPRADSSWWSISTSSYSERLEGIPESEGVVAEEKTGNTAEKWSILQEANYKIQVAVVNGGRNTHEWTVQDLTITCPGATNITADGVISVPSPGNYLVTCVDRDGNQKSKQVSVTSGQVNYYWLVWQGYGDTPAARWQQYINQRVLNAITDVNGVYAGRGHTYSYAWPEQDFKRWRFKRSPGSPYRDLKNGGAGWVGWNRPHLISPHVWATATHYGSLAANGNPEEIYISDDWTVTSKVRVVTSTRVALDKWALANGFSQEDVNKAGCGDITVGTFLQDDPSYDNFVDPRMCPYFCDPEKVLEKFGDSGMGCLGWINYQGDAGWCYPAWFNNMAYSTSNTVTGVVTVRAFGSKSQPKNYEDGYWTNITARSTNQGYGWRIANLVPAEVLSVFDEEQKKITGDYPGWEFSNQYVGDSGLPNYVEPEPGIWLLNFSNTSVGSGPNYHQALPILKAYVESQGDTLKIYEFPDEPPTE